MRTRKANIAVNQNMGDDPMIEGRAFDSIGDGDDLNFKSFNLGHGTVKDKRRKLDAYKQKLLFDEQSYRQCQEVLNDIKKKRA